MSGAPLETLSILLGLAVAVPLWLLILRFFQNGRSWPEEFGRLARRSGGPGEEGKGAPLELDPLYHGGLEAAAHQAGAEIQERPHCAAPGQLSLAGDAAGALSLTVEGPGQLSLAATRPTDGEGTLS